MKTGGHILFFSYLLVLEAAFIRRGLSRHHQGKKMVPGIGVAAVIGFAAQSKPARFESAGASVLDIFSVGVNPDDATEAQEFAWEKCAVHIAICSSADVSYTAQTWQTQPLH